MKRNKVQIIGTQTGEYQRLLFVIEGGYFYPWKLDIMHQIQNMDISPVFSLDEWSTTSEGIEYKLYRYGPRYHAFIDFFLILMAVLFGGHQWMISLFFGLLLLVSTLYYQHQLTILRMEIQNWLDIRNETTFALKKAHWKWGMEDFTIVLDYFTDMHAIV